MYLRVASKAHGGFWGVGQHITSQALKCSVVWYLSCGFFFFGEGVFLLGFCESLNHDFIACGCQYWNSCLSSSPALPKSLLISLCCQGEKIYIYTKASMETFEDLLFLNISDYHWQMNAIRVLFFKNDFQCKICCKITVVLSSLPVHYVPNKVPGQKVGE